MCLKTYNEFKQGETVPEFGYKVFAYNPVTAIFNSELKETHRDYLQGVEYTSEHGMGYHVFFDLEGAKAWNEGSSSKYSKIVKVKVADVTAKGMQFCCDDTNHMAFTCQKFTIVEVIE